MPRVFAGLELEHLALPERKFEQFSGFCEAKLSVPVSSSPQLDSHSGIQSAISFGNRNAVSMGYWSQGWWQIWINISFLFLLLSSLALFYYTAAAINMISTLVPDHIHVGIRKLRYFLTDSAMANMILLIARKPYVIEKNGCHFWNQQTEIAFIGWQIYNII